MGLRFLGPGTEVLKTQGSFVGLSLMRCSHIYVCVCVYTLFWEGGLVQQQNKGVRGGVNEGSMFVCVFL